MKGSLAKYLLIIGSGALIVFLLLQPQLPKSLAEGLEVSDDPLDQKVDRAVALVQGTNPMEGIMLLREVLEEDSNHIGALMNMGYFSLQSGQTEKAVQRFEQVLSVDVSNVEAWWQMAHLTVAGGNIEKAVAQFEQVLILDHDRKYKEVHFFLGKGYATLEKRDEALEQFELYLPFATDTVIGNNVERYIAELKDR